MAKQLFIALLLLFCLSLVFENDEQEWTNFKRGYDKHYPTKEDEKRARHNYFQNKRSAIKAGVHAASSSETSEPAQYGINGYSDMSYSDFEASHCGYHPSNRSNRTKDRNSSHHSLRAGTISGVSIDWSQTKYMSPPRQQGHCGSCWAFASSAALETAYAILKGATPKYFSPQQLVDCVQESYGCSGGHPATVYDYATNKGIVFESKYPYSGHDGYCNQQTPDFKIDSQDYATDESGIIAALKQPLTVGVYASDSWMSYKSGIMVGTACNQRSTANHAVLLVGVTDNYWKIKNSWGTGWGEQGYIRLARGNTCLVQEDVTWPVITGLPTS